MTSESSFRIHYSVIEPKKKWYTVVLNMKPTSNSLHRKTVMLFYGVTKDLLILSTFHLSKLISFRGYSILMQ